MATATHLIWWSAITLEVFLLFRGVTTALVRKYPLFYVYITCILTTELLRISCYNFAPTHYQGFFWNTELLTIAASYVVVLEIFRSALRHNSGFSLVVQTILLIVFVLALSYSAMDLLQGGFSSLPRAIAELSRDLRYIEGVLLLVMLWFFGRYRISLGRSLLGLIVGYSFWVGLNVVNFALLFLPDTEFSIEFRQFLPLSFVATLAIWSVTLWSAQPEPVQPAASELEHDYQLLAAKTQHILLRSSRRLVRTTRP